MSTDNLELTNEMVERNDVIDNAVYALILTLTEESEDELPWDMEIIEAVTDAVKDVLCDSFGKKIRHPAVVTNDDGSQYYVE